MKVVALANIKGGVGKTSTVVNLAATAARDANRCLVVDLDPQGASSYYFRTREGVAGGLRGFLKKSRDLRRSIRGTDVANLDLLPADLSFRELDVALHGRRSNKLERRLGSLADEYDLVLLDCPPGLSSLSENVFSACDYYVIPTVPTTLSLRTLNQLIQHYSDRKRSKDRLLAFFSMVDRRKQMHRAIVDRPPLLTIKLLENGIPNASEIERMGIERSPVVCTAPACNASKAYYRLWRELSALL